MFLKGRDRSLFGGVNKILRINQVRFCRTCSEKSKGKEKARDKNVKNY